MLATGPLTKDVMCKKLKIFTTEFLQRPGIGVSEMAETFQENSRRLRRHFTTVNNLFEKANDLINVVELITAKISNLNMKKTIDRSKVKKDLKSLVKVAYGKDTSVPDSTLLLLEKACHVGGSLYLLGIYWQYLNSAF